MTATPSTSLITLLTDFGAADVFVGSMKGVILGINPQAQIVDLTHDVPAHNIRAGAYLLHSASRHFPPGTIHVAIVDPGVGSERRPILVTTSLHSFLAPDNGLLSYIMAAEPSAEVRVLTAKQYFLGTIGSTFHGRDVFAPAAAWLSLDEPTDAFGPRIKDPVCFEVRRPALEGDTLIGEVLHIDRFGNLITNISRGDLVAFAGADHLKTVRLHIQNIHLEGLQDFYAHSPSRTLSALINSDDLLELFTNKGRATDLVKAGVGDRVEVRLA
ncbi:MAG: SAM-dependent chlorinase/fluorinase [Nitrospirae bacterium]|nr:MAG: SAM-dependent chlorinase/fluorinase [Nitrospirota bacterium]